MDDCLSFRTNWTKQPEMIDMMNKTSNVMNIFSIQSPLSFTKDFRDSFDYVFFMHEAFISNVKRLHSYASFIENFDDFNKIFTRIFSTDYYNMMVIDNTQDSILIEDRIFWYKANVKLPKFEMTNYKNDITICEYYGKNIVSSYDSDAESSNDNEEIVKNKTDYNNDMSQDSIDSSSDIYMNQSTPSITESDTFLNTFVAKRQSIALKSDSAQSGVTKVIKNKVIKNKDINITINNDKIIVCKNNITVNILIS